MVTDINTAQTRDHRGLSRRCNPENEPLLISGVFLLLRVRVTMWLDSVSGAGPGQAPAATHHPALRTGCPGTTFVFTAFLRSVTSRRPLTILLCFMLHSTALSTAGVPYSTLTPSHCPSRPSWMSLVRAGACAAGDGLHGCWAEATSQTLRLALGVAHPAQSHCRAWMKGAGCWLRLRVRPSGLVPWLATNTLSHLRSFLQSISHTSWGQPPPPNIPRIPPTPPR